MNFVNTRIYFYLNLKINICDIYMDESNENELDSYVDVLLSFTINTVTFTLININLEPVANSVKPVNFVIKKKQQQQQLVFVIVNIVQCQPLKEYGP